MFFGTNATSVKNPLGHALHSICAELDWYLPASHVVQSCALSPLANFPETHA
jgi:hypothetical protein